MRTFKIIKTVLSYSGNPDGEEVRYESDWIELTDDQFEELHSKIIFITMQNPHGTTYEIITKEQDVYPTLESVDKDYQIAQEIFKEKKESEERIKKLNLENKERHELQTLMILKKKYAHKLAELEN